MVPSLLVPAEDAEISVVPGAAGECGCIEGVFMPGETFRGSSDFLGDTCELLAVCECRTGETRDTGVSPVARGLSKDVASAELPGIANVELTLLLE